MKYNLLQLCYFLLPALMLAQEPELITLDRALDIAYANSPAIKQSQLGLERSRYSLDAQNAALKSQFALNVTPIDYTRGRNFDQRTSQYYSSETTQSYGTFSVVQPVKYTDGQISLVNQLRYRDSYSDATDVQNQGFTNTVAIQIDQPLFTYNRTKLQLRELELDLENSELNYAMQRLSIERLVTSNFYAVYSAQTDLQIAREELENQQKSYEIIKNKVDAGLKAREELYQAEVNLMSSQSGLYNAEVSLENQKDQFKILVGMPLEQEFSVLANVEINPVEVDLSSAINYALAQRMEIRQREIELESAQFQLIQTKSLNEFRGDLSLSLGLFGQAEEIQNLYDKTENDQQVSVSFQIPLWDWGERKSRIKAVETSIESQQITYEEEKKDIVLNIRQVYRNLKNLLNQVEIAKKNLENSQLTYEINLERYENGDLTSLDLNLIQEQLSDAKISLTNARINYKLEILNLKIQTLYDFENNETVVPEELAISIQLNSEFPFQIPAK